MSVAATNYVWTQSPAEGADRLVLLALADFADESGNCFGSWGKLEEKTRLARRTVADCLRRLQKSGQLVLVERGSRKVAGSGLQASIWTIPGVAEMGAGNAPKSERWVQEMHLSGANAAPKWCNPCTPTIDNNKKRNISADAPAPATSSPSLPSSSEKEAPKPKRATAPKFDPASLPLPHGPGFQKWWLHFIEHRASPIKGRRNPLTPLAAKIILGELSAVNEQQAVESIKKCIAAGWVKPFPPEPPQKPTIVELPPQGRPKQTALERSLAEMREQFEKENAA
jgi:hypothetical protein